MGSLRETLIQSVVTRLEAIKTGQFNNRGRLKSVQRRTHRRKNEDQMGNLFSDTPTIILSVPGEEGNPNTAGSAPGYQKSISIDILWVEVGGDWTCQAETKVFEDLERALFPGGDTGFGVGATEVKFATEPGPLFDSTNDVLFDSARMTVTMNYLSELGSPEIGA